MNKLGFFSLKEVKQYFGDSLAHIEFFDFKYLTGSEEEMSEIIALMRDVKTLRMTGQITREMLENLAQKQQLAMLSLSCTQMRNENFTLLANCTKLRELTLDGRHLTQNEMKHLAGLTQLRSLYIGYSDMRQGVILKDLAQEVLPAYVRIDLFRNT